MHTKKRYKNVCPFESYILVGKINNKCLSEVDFEEISDTVMKSEQEERIQLQEGGDCGH